MKKVLAVILLFVILTSASTLAISAFPGTGIEVIAEGVSVVKTGLFGRKLSFTDADFKCAFAVDNFGKIKILSLPASSEGTLLLAGRRVRTGQEIRRRNIAALIFVPASREISEATFTFSLDGGAECICRMRFVDKVNLAPKVDGASDTASVITTQRDIGVFGKIDAVDPEGDKLEYMIVSYPKSGYLYTDNDGKYKYTPKVNFTGYDSFVYVVRDEYGNYSEPAEVSVKVIERMSEVVYPDMIDSEEYNAAVAMSALGIMEGKIVGSEKYFEPTLGVSRAEFVAMAMRSYGLGAGVGESYFDDNGDIPRPLVGYVARAQRLGIIDGEYSGGELTFSPNKIVTVYEAADIISRMIGAKGDGEASVYSDAEGVPVWARGSIEAMVTMGILDKDAENLTANLSRGGAAEMLYRLIKNK